MRKASGGQQKEVESISDGYQKAVKMLSEGFTADRPMVVLRWR